MKYAPQIRRDAHGKIIIAIAKCQGCGEDIKSTEIPTDLQWVVTKRGTAVFFHEKCAGKVWGRKIPT